MKLENGRTQEVLYSLEDLETENEFPSDVHTLRYIASILRCNSFQDLEILQGPQVVYPFIPTPEHVLRNLRYERHIPREERWLEWDAWGDHLRSDPPGPSPQSPPGPRPLSPPGPRPLSQPTDQDYADAFGTPNIDITRRSDAFASRRTTPR